MSHLSLEFGHIGFLLSIQYRMNEHIMRWSSDFFYKCKLVASETVASIRLSDISNVPINSVQNQPLVLIDTGNSYYFRMRESRHLHSNSVSNPGEANLVYCYLLKLLEFGVEQQHIGVITPYALQVLTIQRIIGDKFNQVTVNTVDGFQGREKEVIILSMVRSNEQGNVGFLADQRRMNVSVTRARRHLVVIADGKTMGKIDHIGNLLNVIEKYGLVQKADDYKAVIRAIPRYRYKGRNVR